MSPDSITPQGIHQYLDGLDLTITVLDTVSSTNTLAANEAKKGADEGRLMVANHQTAGRGRLGRCFFSPEETGIYMSIVLRPDALEDAGIFTTIAAVSVCEAIEAVTGETAEIKWVNDVFVKGKKVCGILTECGYDLEKKAIEYAIVGIGINVYEPENGFPPEISATAGAICKNRRQDLRNHLIAACFRRFYHYYKAPDWGAYHRQYRSRSLVLGKTILVHTPRGARCAVAQDMDAACRLLVRYDDGQQEYLSSGEISISLL